MSNFPTLYVAKVTCGDDRAIVGVFTERPKAITACKIHKEVNYHGSEVLYEIVDCVLNEATSNIIDNPSWILI
jgi:hypothetical protein